MPAAASYARKSLLALVGSALALTGLQLVSPPAALANPAGTGLVINEFYGGGGNTGAPYSNDFVELFNPTDQPIRVDGWSVQYTSAAGTSITASGASQGWTALSGSVPAHGYYLVQEAAGTTVTDKPLPTPDATGVIPMGAGGGKLFLVSSTTLLSGTQLAAGAVTPGEGIFASVVDMVGGNTPNQYEGAKVTSNPANATSMSRNAAHADTDNNLADFPTPYAAPTPKNSSNVDSGVSLPSVNPITAKSWTINTAITGITPGATGGTPPYTFVVTGLPAGVVFDGATITGTPTAAGSGQATVKVTDSAGKVAQTSFDWTVGAAPTPSTGHVVISEVWGDGGFSGTPYKNSYVELYNPTDAAVSLAGYSLGYLPASNSGTVGATQQSNLGGSIPAHGYYLIAGTSSGTAGVALPQADATSTIAWHYADGTIALLDTQTAVSLPGGNLTGVAHVVDAVGYGPTSGFVPVAYEGAVTGFVTDKTVAAYRDPVGTDTNNNAVDFKAGALSPTNSKGQTGTAGGGPLPTTCASGFPVSPAVAPIAQIQGNTDISAGINCTVTTTGVVTAVYSKGYNLATGAATCGSCGFYIQDPNGDPNDDRSDAIFVFGGSKFNATLTTASGTEPIAVGDSVRVTGKISEFGATGGTQYLTELTSFADTVGNVTHLTPALKPVTPQTTLPTTYAAREAHEGELFTPTDVVVTDTYNFESQGELGLASGNKPLQQPGQICRDGDAACIAAAQADVKDRGYFLTGGTQYLKTTNPDATFYDPGQSKNSDIPLPFIDKTHSARVGAHVTYVKGGVLDFRNNKWYLNPPRSVVADHDAASPDLGQDVVTFEDTRARNQAPRQAPAGSNMRFATYNVENFFSIPAKDFEAANPWFKDSGPGCEYDNDRAGQPLLVFQCTSPTGMASAWDPVTGAVTAYSSGLVNAPRGAARQVDLDRQTAKIVTAINRLDADVVALEEIGNPNKLKLGVTSSPLKPDLTNTKDQGQGTAIAWRDATVSYLVDHLNAALPAGADQWAFAASPEEATDATAVAGLCSKVQPNGTPVPGPANLAGTCSYASGQDVIRSAFIYKKAKVIPVGSADLDLPGYTVNGTPDPWGNHVFAPNASPFDNAREPFAQYFKPVGAANDEGFALIVNHFKSKGDADAPAGPAVGGDKNDDLHGAFNATRVAQAKELLRFANEFADRWDTDKVFMLGDFNAYSGEDPIHAIEDADNTVDPLDFKEIHSDDPNDTSYVFTTTVDGIGYGGAGSLDHIFASAGARATSPKTDIWEINANEPGVYNYGRYNTNKTDFWDPATPFGGSDHNPEVVDLTLPSASAGQKVTDVQILGINDFHGRLIADASDGGAAPLAGAVNALRGIYGADHTVLASAGDNVGASIFESFTQKDKPTLDALNAMNLQVSSVGNHEFDHGVSDLLGRIEKPKSDTNPYGADDPLSWGDYLAANVVWSDGPNKGQPISAPTRMISVDNPLNPGNPIKIGFVGTVTSDLPSLQSPENLAGVTVLGNAATIDKVNEYAAHLKGDGADLVVLLTHEGAASTDCSAMKNDGAAFSKIINGVDADVDAILSGHTHLEYSCQFGVPEWAAAGRAITKRPVMQGASYGTALDQLVYSFDADNEPVALIANNVGVKGPGGALFTAGEDPKVQPIVTRAIADSAEAGAKVLGTMTGPLYRAKLSDGTDNRGGESTLGNQVAEIQRWATAGAQQGSAQIAFMNPGGLRADALGTKSGDVYNLTYREAADVQPFANELVNMKLTGAQIKKVLEQQWQRDASGNIPARPFLKLGISKGFTYTYTETQDPAKPAGAMLGTVTGMWLNGTPIDLDTTYSVTVNSFLATGGDNFWELNNGSQKLDTEQTDLQAQVDYMAKYQDTPLSVDYSQRAVAVTFPKDAPASYAPGGHVVFDLKSLDMTGTGDQQDGTVTVRLGTTELGSFPIAHGNNLQPYDDRGTAHVDVVLPQGIAGPQTLTVVGDHTGTKALVALSLPKVDSAVHAEPQTATYGAPGELDVTVAGTAAPTGTVTFTDGGTPLGTAPVGADGVAALVLDTVTLASGTHTVTASYSGDSGLNASTATFAVTVAKGSPTVDVAPVSAVAGEHADVPVAVTAGSAPVTGTVTVRDGATVLGSGELTDGGVVVDVDSSALSVGEHTLTAAYAGSDDLLASSAEFTMTVGLAPSSVTGKDVSVAYGSALALSATVTPASAGGTVTFSEGSTQLGSAEVGEGGVATLTYAGALLPVGTHQVVAAYSGDARHASAVDELTVTITRGASDITAGAASAKAGQDGSLIVTVTGPGPVRPSGTVTVKDGGHPIGHGDLVDGTATVRVDTSSLALGDHTLSLQYSGDATFAPDSGTVVLTVAKAVPTVTVTSATQAAGKAAGVEVKVTGQKSSTGAVTLRYGSTVLGSASFSGAKVTITVPAGALPPGSYTLTATYGGDGSNEGQQSGAGQLTVTPAPAS